MNTVSLALRNLLRNRRRSITTILAMIVGLVAILLFGGYIADIREGLQTGYVQRGGHLQIQHKDYYLFGSGDPAAYGIADYVHIIEVLKRDPILAPLLAVVTPTLQIGGIAGNFAAGVSRTIFASGTVVSDQNEMLKWNEYGFRSAPDESSLTNTAADSAVIGTGVARVLQLCRPLNVPNCPRAAGGEGGDENGSRDALPSDVAGLASGAADAAPGASNRIEILAANAHGAPNVAAVKVVRAEYQGVKEFDDVFVALHLGQAQRLVYGADTPAVTAIVLQLHRTEDMPSARARLDTLLATSFKDAPLEIQEFATLNPFYGQTLAMFAVLFTFIASLIGAIVLFTVGNTMSTAVIERTAEIGTLRAMGLRRGGIRRLFLSEGVLLGALGAVLGIGFALSFAALINHGGLTWIPPGRVEPVSLTVRVWGESRLIWGGAIGMVVVAALSATWPAARAARLNIVDALRHV